MVDKEWTVEDWESWALFQIKDNKDYNLPAWFVLKVFKSGEVNPHHSFENNIMRKEFLQL